MRCRRGETISCERDGQPCTYPRCLFDLADDEHLHTFSLRWSGQGQMVSNGVCNTCGEVVRPDLLTKAVGRAKKP